MIKLFSKSSKGGAAPLPPADKNLQSAESQRLAFVNFLHESIKKAQLKPFIKNFRMQSDKSTGSMIVLVDLQDTVGMDSVTLVARWQIMMMDVARFAKFRGIDLAGIYCNLPIDQSTPMQALEARAFGPPREAKPKVNVASHSTNDFSSNFHSSIMVSELDAAAEEEFYKLNDAAKLKGLNI